MARSVTKESGYSTFAPDFGRRRSPLRGTPSFLQSVPNLRLLRVRLSTLPLQPPPDFRVTRTVCFRSTLFLQPLTTQDCTIFSPVAGAGSCSYAASSTTDSRGFPDLPDISISPDFRLSKDISRPFPTFSPIWLLISLHASTPSLFNLFLTYMLVFPSLVFIIFKDFVCPYLLHFVCRSGGLIYETTRIMQFVIF